MNDCSMFLDSIGNVFKFVSLYERDDVDPVKTASYKQTINPFVKLYLSTFAVTIFPCNMKYFASPQHVLKD